LPEFVSGDAALVMADIGAQAVLVLQAKAEPDAEHGELDTNES
jgi:hypothetical protein